MKDFNWQGHREDSITAKERVRNVGLAQVLIQERARRLDYFPAELFAEPAWDILLALYVAQMTQQRVTAGQLTEMATIPHTTILRWTKVLDAAGYLLRRVDPLDARRAFVLLTPKGLDAMYRFLSGGSDQIPGAPEKVNASQYRVGGDPMRQWRN
jgi:DNA-binding MarR family transcriptional regulator